MYKFKLQCLFIMKKDSVPLPSGIPFLPGEISTVPIPMHVFLLFQCTVCPASVRPCQARRMSRGCNEVTTQILHISQYHYRAARPNCNMMLHSVMTWRNQLFGVPSLPHTTPHNQKCLIFSITVFLHLGNRTMSQISHHKGGLLPVSGRNKSVTMI